MSQINWSEPDARWYGTANKGRYTIYLMPENGKYAVFINRWNGEKFDQLEHLQDFLTLEIAKAYAQWDSDQP